jgi:CheY-like chemotaxis protein
MTLPHKDLLDQLADLQLTLEGYSLEKLTVAQALEVRESFQQFLKVMESFHVPLEWEKRAGMQVAASPRKDKSMQPSDTPLRDAGVLCHTGNPLGYGDLGRKLHGLGSRVYLAADTDTLVQLAQSKSIDIILLDAEAPLQDINATIDQVRAPGHPCTGKVPVLVISRNPGSPLKTGAADSGVYTLNSPSEDELFAAVSRLIAEHKSDAIPMGNDLFQEEQNDLNPARGEEAAGDPCGAEANPEEQKQLFSRAVLEYTGRMRIAISRGDFSGIADACRILRPQLHLWGAGALLDFTEDILVSALKGKDLERIAQAQEEFLSLYPLVLKTLDGRADR